MAEYATMRDIKQAIQSVTAEEVNIWDTCLSIEEFDNSTGKIK
jgi:hypothetical protein